MSRSYRSALIAAGLITALSGLALGQAQDQSEKAQWSAQQERGPTHIAPLPLPIEIVEDETAAKARESQEAESRQREIEDLAAQKGMNAATEAMNKATQKMAKYAFWSTIFVGIGTALLIITLWFTRQANRAAQEAIDVTRDIGKKQIRAYLVCEPHAKWAMHPTNKSDKYLTLHVNLVNTGQSPAREVKIYSHSRLIDKGLIDYDPTTSFTEDPMSTTVCAPGRSIPSVTVNVADNQLREAISKGLLALFYVRATYRDVFEAEWLAEGCFTAEIFEIPDEEDSARVSASVVIRTYKQHNSAT